MNSTIHPSLHTEGNSQFTSDIRILFIHPSPRFGGSGYYIQELALQLKKLGCSVLVFAEGECPEEDQGVRWHRIGFSGPFLAPDTKELAGTFNPNIILQAGVRTIPMRAALELLLQTRAHLVVQAEDDEFVPYAKHHPNPDMRLLEILDKPKISIFDIARFASRVDWAHTSKVLLDPSYYRWVEPVLRILCYRLADLHSAIWHPMAERLSKRFAKPIMIVPPVVALADFDPVQIDPDDRSSILKAYGIDPQTTVFFIAGTVYSYSDEYLTFLDALRKLAISSNKPITVAVSGRGWRAVDEIAQRRLRGTVQFVNLSAPDDEQYNALIKASDIICSPGFPNTFNKYRLPSRLVKAMALSKPVLTCRCGFGESLQDGYNAFLTEGMNSSSWAQSMSACLDLELRKEVGRNGRLFAERYFDSKPVAVSLMNNFCEMLKYPPKFRTHTNLLEGDYKTPFRGRLRKLIRRMLK